MSENKFSFRIPKKETKPPSYKRIEAMFSYWEFINSIRKEIYNYSGGEEELAEEIISLGIRYLYPKLNITETTYQIINTYKILELPLPNGFHNLISDAYEDYFLNFLRRAE